MNERFFFLFFFYFVIILHAIKFVLGQFLRDIKSKQKVKFYY